MNKYGEFEAVFNARSCNIVLLRIDILSKNGN